MNIKIIFTFVFFILAFAALTHFLSEPSSSDKMAPLQHDWISGDTPDAATAKNQRKLWAEDWKGHKAALNFRENPDLFNILFPGYPDEMRTDEKLWSQYFQRRFDSDSYFIGVEKELKTDLRVVMSWLGCLDIYEKYGADIVVVGSSEVFRQIVPDLLSESLKTRFAEKNPRVLMCTSSAIPFDSLHVTFQELSKRTQKKVPALVWGFSYWSGHERGQLNRLFLRDKNFELEKFYRSHGEGQSSWLQTLLKLDEYQPSFLFHVPSWNQAIPYSYDEMERNESERTLLARALKKSKNKQKGGYVPTEYSHDPEVLEKNITERLEPYYRTFDDMTEQDCIPNRLSEKIKILIKEAESFAERVFIYLPPTTPLQFEAGFSCFRPMILNELNLALSETNARSDLRPWKKWNLDYRFYLRPTSRPEVMRVDINHTNYEGAQRLTQELSLWLNQSWNESERSK